MTKKIQSLTMVILAYTRKTSMWSRGRVSAGLCCYGKKVANLEILLFSATKQDKVGPGLQSKNSLFTYAACSTHLIVQLDPSTA